MSYFTFSLCPVAGVVFRLLLLASLWEGPVLWGHTHNSATPGLSAHLARLHQGQLAAMNIGWHWHLSLPESGQGEQSDGKFPKDYQPTVVLTSAGLMSCVSSPLSVPAAWADSYGANCGALQPQFMSRVACSTIIFNSSPQQTLCRMSC